MLTRNGLIKAAYLLRLLVTCMALQTAHCLLIVTVVVNIGQPPAEFLLHWPTWPAVLIGVAAAGALTLGSLVGGLVLTERQLETVARWQQRLNVLRWRWRGGRRR